MNTPISSFWIIPKQMNVHPQDSEKLLYMYGVDKCEKKLKTAFDKTNGIEKLCIEEQRSKIKGIGNDMRTVAESLFKLIMCFYQERYQFEVNDYDDLLLKHLTKPLKKTFIKVLLSKNDLMKYLDLPMNCRMILGILLTSKM